VKNLSTSISITEPTRNKLTMLKMEEGFPNMEALITRLIVQYKKDRLLEASKKFRKRMDEMDLTLEDLIE